MTRRAALSTTTPLTSAPGVMTTVYRVAIAAAATLAVVASATTLSAQTIIVKEQR